MPITELGACEWFVWDLRRSNLMDRSQLDQVVGEFLRQQPRADPPALAEFLIGQQILTAFQAERLLQGKTQGLVLGPYTLTDALGAGSMGTVYKAQSKNDSQWYAVKVLPRRSMWNVRIARRQVRSFEQCKHPAVVPFVDVGTAGSMHYLAWPLVEGRTLEAVVAEGGKLSPGLAAHYALQTAEGLEVCHQQNLVHGLLKPSNLMVATDGQVKILDFGIGSLLAETGGESLVDTMSTANSLTSGLDCASPESIMEPTNRTPAGDQYSLGCVLYYCLTGGYPFPEGSAVEKMMAHQMKQPAPITGANPDVPAALVAVVERLMQKAPEARFGTLAEVIEALRPLATGGTTAAPAAPKPRPAAPRAAAAAAAARHEAKPAAAESAAPARPAPRPAPRAPQPSDNGSAAVESRPNRAPAGPTTPRPQPTKPLAVRAALAADDVDDEGAGRFGWWMTLCGLVAVAALAAWAWVVLHR
jgi:serine/threonine-protein kinase